MKGPSARLLTLLAIAALLPSCAPARHITTAVAAADDPGRPLLAGLAARYPSEFSASQRILLTVHGREYDLAGFLARKGGTTRALAYGELGGKIFDFELAREGSRVLLKPDGMPRRPLSKGVLRDIAHLYGAAEVRGRPLLIERPAGGVCLVVPEAGTAIVTEYLFSKGDGSCEAVIESRRGKIVRRVEFSDYRLFPGWERPVPALILVRNYRWDYTLRIELLTLHAGPAGAGP